ncbi:MAG: penicillin-binding protein 2 [Flavobacteriaceae bacterium]
MRKIFLAFSIVLVGLIFLSRLFYLQVYNNNSNSFLEDNAIKKVFDYPKRGYVYDRNNILLVANQPSYDIMIIPREVKPFDTLELCRLLKITKIDFDKRLKRAKNYSPRLPSPFVSQVSKNDFAVLQEKLWKYEGFFIQKKAIRDYKVNIGANVLGSIGEVNRSTIKKDPYYLLGDMIGKEGIEVSYEKTLRGSKGVKFIQKDRFNRAIGPYKNGIYDTLPVPGKNITLTIDSKLQEYGEFLMQNKRGGIIAIEPKSGEILSMISAPSYNPNLLVGRERSKNYTKLHYDSISKPLYDRGLQAMYPPGSPFKIINALIALEENTVTTNEKFKCNRGYFYGNRKMGCHIHKNPVDLNLGIYESCNAYFANIYRRTIEKYSKTDEGLKVWSDHVKSFGLGNYLGYDLKVGQPGKIPTPATYDRAYGKGRWFSTYTISNAIGQGEILTTPIQLANMTAAIANRGYFFTPHIIKKIDGDSIDRKYTIARKTSISPEHFEPVIEGMFNVYKKGTAKYIQVNGIEICGKTGTAENFTRINGKQVQLTDHSIFIAFAPKNDPKIAIAVFVENGYWGNRYAGKIASLMIEKYLKKSISRNDLENWITSHSLEEEYAKPFSGEPFKINQ